MTINLTSGASPSIINREVISREYGEGVRVIEAVAKKMKSINHSLLLTFDPTKHTFTILGSDERIAQIFDSDFLVNWKLTLVSGLPQTFTIKFLTSNTDPYRHRTELDIFGRLY